jgi:glutamate formiminotransferase
MQRVRILCIPNFSEGRDAATIRAIVDAVASAGVQVHHLSWDEDHHRTVLAFSGNADAGATGQCWMRAQSPSSGLTLRAIGGRTRVSAR